MSKIQVLDPITIDKIAAGEVIERPVSYTHLTLPTTELV